MFSNHKDFNLNNCRLALECTSSSGQEAPSKPHHHPRLLRQTWKGLTQSLPAGIVSTGTWLLLILLQHRYLSVGKILLWASSHDNKYCLSNQLREKKRKRCGWTMN